MVLVALLVKEDNGEEAEREENGSMGNLGGGGADWSDSNG